MTLWRAKLIEEAILRVWLRNSADAVRAVAHLFCELHARLATHGLARGHAFDVPATQEQLGDALGMTSVHLNRMLRKLREAGLLSFKDGVVTLLDKDSAYHFCSFDPAYLKADL
jgi:CRP-like cAMP-binding protein